MSKYDTETIHYGKRKGNEMSAEFCDGSKATVKFEGMKHEFEGRFPGSRFVFSCIVYKEDEEEEFVFNKLESGCVNSMQDVKPKEYRKALDSVFYFAEYAREHYKSCDCTDAFNCENAY